MNNAPKIAVLLSGCGVFDGSEIHEAVSLLLAIDERGFEYQCFAPNTWQARTMDHFTGEATAIAGDADNRNVLAESARIARGQIKNLAEFDAKDFDAIILPGGFGAVMNLCNFAVKGPACQVNEEVERALKDAYQEGIVIGAMCIAPVVLARVLGKKHILITIGNDKDMAVGIQKMGAQHQNYAVDEVCVDEEHRIVTVPAYMLAKSIKEVARGAQNLMDAVVDLLV